MKKVGVLLFSCAILSAIDSVAPRDAPFGLKVRKQRKLQMQRMGKGEMTPCAINRDPHEFGAPT